MCIFITNDIYSHAHEGSQSWFELGIVAADSHAPPRRSWVSHYNEIAGEDLKEHIGIEFDAHHPLWEELREGDRLGLWAHAIHPGWECRAAAAELQYREWFE